MTQPSARERILEEGLTLACTKGLCRVTFGAVARRAKISKSGTVAHFSSMDGFKRAILDRALTLWRAACFVPSDGQPSGVSDLTTYVRDWINWTSHAGLTGACPIALAIFEYTCNGGSSAVRASVAAAEELWRKTLVDLIDGAISQSELPPTLNSSQMAWDLLGIYLSHHVSWHFLRATDSEQKSVRSIDRLIRCAQSIS